MALGNYHYTTFIKALQQLMQDHNIDNGLFVSIRNRTIDSTVFRRSVTQREFRTLEKFADMIDSFNPAQVHKINLN